MYLSLYIGERREKEEIGRIKCSECNNANVIMIFNHKMNLKYNLHKSMVLMLELSFAISHI